MARTFSVSFDRLIWSCEEGTSHWCDALAFAWIGYFYTGLLNGLVVAFRMKALASLRAFCSDKCCKQEEEETKLELPDQNVRKLTISESGSMGVV